MDADTADLDAQIAKLQEEKRRKLALAERVQREKEKEEAKVLVGLTPTKRKERSQEQSAPKLPTRPSQPDFTSKPPPRPKQALPSVLPIPVQPGKSNLSSSLASLRRATSSSSSWTPPVPRSITFTSRPALSTKTEAGPSRQISPELEVDEPGPQRGEDLTILENLEPGPKEFGRDPEGEHEWLHLEPNSKIRLVKRTLPHSHLQDHLAGRYYLSPSLLYSVIRLSRDGATYDVPVSGDWITIAVVAERGVVKVSGAKEAISDDEDEDTRRVEEDEEKVKQGDAPMSKEARARKSWIKRRGPRKYINLKLCALPPKNRSMGKGAVEGDAMLQLLLFESDARIHDGRAGEEGEARYKGGSGGAYEKWCNLTVGSVIAILNPRVLRPLRSAGESPHPLTLPLAINPTSVDAITLIGQAQDLGCCSATQKDGSRCKTWVDLRVSQVCEYHIHAAVSRGRTGRAEFASATTSFALSTRGGFSNRGGGRGGNFGLKARNGAQAAPKALENGGGGATYIVGGKSVNTRGEGSRGFGEEHIGEKFGRGRAEKRKRAVEAAETEKALSALLQKDGAGGSTGGKYLALLRKSNPAISAIGQGKGKEKQSTAGRMEEEDGESEERKRPFSAGAIKRIGFDPTAKRGERNDEETTRRLEAIASLKENPDRPFRLSRPKDLSRSNVRAPTQAPLPSQARPVQTRNDDDDDMIDLD